MARPFPVWLDCDPGHDDATAILLAGHTPGLRLLGISTIGGNQTLAKVTQNALDVLDALGLSHIDVVAGQPRPLLRAPMLCPEIHGDSGLDGPRGGRLLPRSPRQPLPGKAVNVMFDRISTAYGELLRQDAVSVAPAEGPGPEGDGAVPLAALPGHAAPAAAAAGAPVAEQHGQGEEAGPRVRLVCTGALTNAALLLTVYPEVATMIEVAIMGGCMGVGNTGPVMEFNIQTDPEAAKIVFDSGVPLTMVPLEVTHTVLVTPRVLADIGGHEFSEAPTTLGTSPWASGSLASRTTTAADLTSATAAGNGVDTFAVPAKAAAVPCDTSAVPAEAVDAKAASAFRRTIQELLLFFAETYKRVFHFEYPPLHDPVAVAWVIQPSLFETKHMRVDVETLSVLSYGQTVCDVWGQSSKPPNVNVALRVDVPGFWSLLLQAVARADRVSPINGCNS